MLKRLHRWPAREPLIVGRQGLMSTGLACLLLSNGLRRISGATSLALALAEPVMVFVLAVAVLGERPALLAFAAPGTAVEVYAC